MATTYDYAPLYRSSVGFDRVFNLLENAQRARSISDWPPYDIVKTGDDSYRISIAVAGFAQDDLDITFQSNLLTVTGKKQEASADGYLHRGIAGRPFEHRFELADHVRVNGADLSNGLLSIDLVREIPEALKPRKISIQSEPFEVGCSGADRSAEGGLIGISAEQGRRGNGARQHSGLGRRKR
jgi:molecular chaperone IbpA